MPRRARPKKPKPIPSPDEKAIRRFLKLVTKQDGGCWLWKGHKDADGYGQFWLAGAARWAHRVAYRIYNGDPGGETVDHTCTCPSCVNPSHLRLLSTSANSADRWERARSASACDCPPPSESDVPF